MKIRQVLGAVIVFPAMFAMPLVWLSGVIFHLFTAIIAWGLAGTGFWGYAAGGAAFAFPLVAELVVFVAMWNVTGHFINGYSGWLFLWLSFVALLFGVIALGGWLVNNGEE